MTRSAIYARIDAERTSQDAKWPRDLGANPQRAQYKFYAPHFYLLEEKISRVRSLWYNAEREKLSDELIKIATIAVRALEEVEGA